MSDQEFNIKFVEKLEKREVLYNYYLPEYSRKDISERAWQELADEVKLSVSECKDKWRNLRAVFIRKLKPSPNGSTRRRKAYYLADAMKFCVPFIKVLDSFSNSSFKQEAPIDISFQPESYDEESVSREEDFSDKVQPSQKTYEDEYFKAKKTRRDRSSFGEGTTISSNITEREATLNTSVSEAATSSYKAERKESLKMFLLSVIPEVEDFSDTQIKLFKRKIFSVIDEISGN